MRNLLLFCFIGIFPLSVYAAEDEYVREYTYKATEFDTKFTSRVQSLDGVRQAMIEELGVFVQSVVRMSEDGEGNSTMSHDVVTLTAGIVRTKVLTENWDGSNYYIKAKDLALYASKYHNPQGLVVLGYLYENGQEVEEDTEKAFAYYSEAAKLGSPFGMFQLGRLYQKGIGVAKDKFETAKWYKKAANLGHKKSARKLERMKESGHCC